jgi:uncharacterized protein YkwD
MKTMMIYTYRQFGLSLMLLASCAWLLPTALHAEPNDEPHKIFLPVVTSTMEPSCELNAQEAQIEELLRNHPNQQRVTLSCNPTLSAVARARAEDMGRRRYFNHIDPDGHGPNYLVRQAGYALPSEYSTAENANNIESIGAGIGDAAGMWNAWMNSGPHLAHLLGTHEFYAAQVEYGIGFASVPGSPYQNYWVFISSKPGK